jgi:hypothetical protein
MRNHNVARLTDAELDRARRELAASLALAPARLPGPRADPGAHRRHRHRVDLPWRPDVRLRAGHG